MGNSALILGNDVARPRGAAHYLVQWAAAPDELRGDCKSPSGAQMSGRREIVLCLVSALVLSLAPAASAEDGHDDPRAVHGVVTSDEGAPLEGVCVELETTNGEPVAETTSGADGSFGFEDLGDGAYVVGINLCADHVPGWAAQWWDGENDAIDATPVIVAQGSSGGPIAVELAPAGAISGRVVDGDEPDDESDEPSPLAEICVTATEEDTNATVQAITGADGAYLLGNVPDGRYFVTFEDCGSERFRVAELYPNISMHEDPRGDAVFEVVRVRPGDEVTDIDADLVTGGIVEGTVEATHTGAGQPFVCVAAYDIQAEGDERFGPVAITGVDPLGGPASDPGAYQMTDLPPAEYEVVFNDPACIAEGFEAVGASGDTYASATRTVTVAAEQVVTGVDGAVAPVPSIAEICIQLPEEASGVEAFSDVPEDNAHFGAVLCAAEREIAQGVGGGRYMPSASVRRDQMASFIARLLTAAGVALPTSPRDHFADDNGNRHELAINQLAELGIVVGRGDGRYDPAGLVPRAAMTTFLVRAYEHAAGLTIRASEAPFGDVAGNTHEENINRAAAAGIAAGTTATTFAPTQNVRRDQMASFIMRTLDRLVRDSHAVSSTVAAAGGVYASTHLGRNNWKGHWTRDGWYISMWTRANWLRIRWFQFTGVCKTRFGISKYSRWYNQNWYGALFVCYQSRSGGGVVF
jgi:hypothetical protein